MRTLTFILIGFSILGALAAAEQPQPPAAKAQPGKVWAGLSVYEPLAIAFDRAPRVSLSFALVNDGDKAIDPEVGASKLLVNGKDWSGWPAAVTKEQASKESWKALPPRGFIEFTMPMGQVFPNTGIYTVSWQGKDFQSSEVVFRVITYAEIRGQGRRSAPDLAGLAPKDVPPQAEAGKVWAGLSVTKPLVIADGKSWQGFMGSYTLVNDGEKAVEQGVRESVVVIDGQEMLRSGMGLANGVTRVNPTNPGVLMLGPKGTDQFTRSMSWPTIGVPGVHKISWRASHFQSNTVVFRVLASS